MVTDEDYDKNTPLMLAIESGSEEVVEKLISYGSNVNHINKVRTHIRLIVSLYKCLMLAYAAGPIYP